MNAPTPPPWLALPNEVPPEQPPEVERRPDGTFPPGVSGNPGGKKRGTRSARTIMAETFDVDAAAIARVVTEKALAGDMQAAGLVLQRLMPPLRPKSERTPFSLDVSQPLAAQAAAVVQAVADGELSGEEAQVVLSCLQTYVALAHSDTIEQRLQALERVTAAVLPRGGIVYMETPT